MVCFGDICMSYGDFSLIWGFGGVPPSLGGFGGISTWHVNMLILVQFCSSLCLMFVLQLLLLLLQLQWFLLACHQFHQWQWLLPWWGFLLPWISVEWVNHHPWCQEAGGVIGSACVPQQQPPSLMPFLASANYAMGAPQVGFFFRDELPPFCILYVWCPFWCLFSTFRCQVGCCIHLWGLNH